MSGSIAAWMNVNHFLQKILPEVETFLQKLRAKVPVALVGGSDLCKISEQMGGDDGK